MTKEQQLATITTESIKERLALMSACEIEAFVERVAIIAADNRMPLFQAEHEAFERMKRSWQN